MNRGPFSPQWEAFVAEHELWAVYPEIMNHKLMLIGFKQGGGTDATLAWYKSLSQPLRTSIAFVRAFVFTWLKLAPRDKNMPELPELPFLNDLIKGLATGAEARVQCACLHGMQRFIEDEVEIMAAKGVRPFRPGEWLLLS